MHEEERRLRPSIEPSSSARGQLMRDAAEAMEEAAPSSEEGFCGGDSARRTPFSFEIHANGSGGGDSKSRRRCA